MIEASSSLIRIWQARLILSRLTYCTSDMPVWRRKAREVGGRIRAGQVNINGDMELLDPYAPFGGCKRSGNGREWGASGFEAFLEEVAYVGYDPQAASR